MRRWIFFLLLIPMTLHAAGPWTPARHYWGPEDPEGFLQPMPPEPSVEPPRTARTSLKVMALKRRGFLHQGRRQAEALGESALDLQEYARIYTPSQSYVAIQQGDEALAILHPQTAIGVRPLQDGWQWTLTGDRGLVRISTHEHSLALTLAPADPRSVWRNLMLELLAGSDIYLKYDQGIFRVHSIRGRVRVRLDATHPLQSARPQGLLQDWEIAQVRHTEEPRYEFDVFAGQELRLEAHPEFRFQIGLPHAEDWQAAVLRTSPQLTGAEEKGNPLSATLRELRLNWLRTWNGDEEPNKETLYRRLRAGRWEEAHAILQTLEKNPEYSALEAICLYRLQQNALADKKRAALDASGLWADMARVEFLRGKAQREVISLPDTHHVVIPLEELYLLAASEQSGQRWRSALDLWERWPENQSDELLQLSYKEWLRHLDQRKPWSYNAQLAAGWSDNVLHLPPGEAPAAEIGQRSSWLLRSSQELTFLIDRSAAFHMQLESSLDFTLYRRTEFADLQRWEPGLALPMLVQLPWNGQTVQLKPSLSRLFQGKGGLDRFAYELGWRNHNWPGSPELSWTQEQNLDFAPDAKRWLDPLSGDQSGIGDRSVRRNTLRLQTEFIAIGWQSWDYRHAGAKADDRQRFSLRGQYKGGLPYDLQLSVAGGVYYDLFSGLRPSIIAMQMRAEIISFIRQRLRPTLAWERETWQGADSADRMTENLFFTGIHYRW